ncbi:isoprenoid synthase domain-containing protein [Nemania sp. NC0429]|nr:isoprenoid synthase domain-containing protein [Nemania sp. NC0429]
MADNVVDDTISVGDGNAKTPHLSLQPPNAIPPRTSSTNYASLSPPARSALRPVPESSWLAQGIHPHTRSQSRSLTHTHTHTHTHPQTHITPPSLPIQYHLSDMASAGFLDPARYATEDFDYTARQTWNLEKEDAVRGPFNYLVDQPGKDIRTSLINAFNVWLRVPEETLAVIARVVAMLHTSSLLVDDVEDNSLLRRGRPVAHSIFGTAQTINSANYIYFCALQELQKLRNPRAVSIFSEELVNLHRGQGMDLYWRDSLICPTEDHYLEMVGNKTGGLFRLAIKLMQAESEAPSLPVVDCVPLVNVLGILFQVQDDYRNLSSPEYGENKGFCEDLTEGKFSFLIIHSIRADPRNLQLINILKQKTTDVEVKRYAVEYMRRTGSFEYTKRVIDILIDRARKATDELDALDGSGRRNLGIHQILDKLAV